MKNTNQVPGNTTNAFCGGISQGEEGEGPKRRGGSRDGGEGGKAKMTRNRRISGGRCSGGKSGKLVTVTHLQD